MRLESFKNKDEQGTPKIITDVGFDFNWSEPKVWALDLPKENVDIRDLEWHFDIPFWNTAGGQYDLRPRDVMENPEKHREEYSRTMNADMACPIDIMENKGRWLILDGLHRLVKAKLEGKTEVEVRKVPRSAIPMILEEETGECAEKHQMIRKATVEDLPRIHEVTELAYRIPYKEGALVTKAHEPNNVRERLLNNELFILVAVDGEDIVGAVKYEFDASNNLELSQLAVLPSHRNTGIGTSLMRELEEVARTMGCKKMKLDCAQEKQLHRFYEQLGFAIDAIKPHRDHHDVFMSKTIV